ncbi:MAG: hypothetical protein N3E51_03515 [Candidatus Micrarchaeota archaeon]|nr:hypothetical protein [Candidatus Micrarchaeota archaeon]
MVKNYAVFGLALALMVALSFPALSVGAPSVSPSVLKPGETGVITMTITNTPSSTSTSASTSALQSVQVYFAAVEGIQFTVQSPVVVGTVSSGASIPVSIPFKVLPTAKGGTVGVPLYVSEKDSPELKTVVAVIAISNPAVITISSDKQTLLSTDRVLLTIKNDGGKAERATLSIPSGSGFSLIGSSQIYIGTIAGTLSVEVPIDASGASSGLNQVPFQFSYQQEGGEQANVTKYLAFSVKKESEELVFSQISKVIASQDNTLQLSVKNNGKPLSNFRIFWEDDELKAKESNQVKLGELPAGAVAQATFLVRADAAPGVRDAKLRLVWSEGGVEKEETVSVPIVVTSDADAAIYIDAKPAPIIAGGEHTLSVLVSNIGSYKILNVEVELADSPAFQVLNAQKSQYIGGLEADDFSTVQYKVRFNKVASGSYPLLVKVRYKDQSGVWVSKDYPLQINVRSPEEVSPANGTGILLPAAVLAVLALGAGYWYFRMRREKGKASAESGRGR